MSGVFYTDTVTVYNRQEADYEETWYPTVLTKVALFPRQSSRFNSTGVQEAINAKLYVHHIGSGYVPPKAWRVLDDKSDKFTFDEGDFFVKGDTSSEDHTRDNFAEYMRGKYDYCYTVAGVDEFDIIPHLEVSGK